MCIHVRFFSIQIFELGSVTSISPATHPKTPAPAVMMTGNRCINFINIVAPKTTNGMLTARPMTSNATLSLATPATASTLSRLITKSAMSTALIALRRLLGLSTCSSSLFGTSKPIAIHRRRSPPMILRYGQ